jgi:hypothetical protein
MKLYGGRLCTRLVVHLARPIGIGKCAQWFVLDNEMLAVKKCCYVVLLCSVNCLPGEPSILSPPWQLFFSSSRFSFFPVTIAVVRRLLVRSYVGSVSRKLRDCY